MADPGERANPAMPPSSLATDFAPFNEEINMNTAGKHIKLASL